MNFNSNKANVYLVLTSSSGSGGSSGSSSVTYPLDGLIELAFLNLLIKDILVQLKLSTISFLSLIHI